MLDGKKEERNKEYKFKSKNITIDETEEMK